MIKRVAKEGSIFKQEFSEHIEITVKSINIKKSNKLLF